MLCSFFFFKYLGIFQENDIDFSRRQSNEFYWVKNQPFLFDLHDATIEYRKSYNTTSVLQNYSLSKKAQFQDYWKKSNYLGVNKTRVFSNVEFRQVIVLQYAGCIITFFVLHSCKMQIK